MINHNKCLHTKDSKGRAACRKAGGPLGHLHKVQSNMIASGEALCYDCFWNATDSAMQNLQDHIRDEGIDYNSEDLIDDAWFLATAYTWARTYLFDDACLSACTKHDHLI